MNRTATLATVGLLVGAPIAANLAFTGLGAAFDYPAVLRKPADEVLATFLEDSTTISAWFGVLALGAAAMAPLAVLVGRLGDDQALKWSVPVGIAAAAVQVTGLLRWPLLVPGLANRAAHGSDGAARAAAIADFQFINQWLGTALGETVGYALTAGWTALVLVALGRALAGRWFVRLGAVSAAMIAAGVVAPLGVPGADEANFVGYVLWSAWLVAFALVLLRGLRRGGVGLAGGPA